MSKEQMIDGFFEEIQELKSKNLFRNPRVFNKPVGSDMAIFDPVSNKKYISFSCNDYFGLSDNPEILQKAEDLAKNYRFSSTSSRYITGNCDLNNMLETKISDIKNTEDAIVFSSGYLANIAAISAICKRGDLILCDKLVHSSILDGTKIALSLGAKFHRFAHNNVEHCEEILKKFRKQHKRCIIVTESVFSMDGDVGKFDKLHQLAIEYDSLLMIDDAHGFGIIDIPENIAKSKNALITGTFSKAIGSYGGYICGDKIIMDYIRNFGKTAIYNTSLPPIILAFSLVSLDFISRNELNLRSKLLDNVQHFSQLTNIQNHKTGIMIKIISEIQILLDTSKFLEDNGFIVSAIRPPSVEEGKSRLRFTFSASHNREDIDKLAIFIKTKPL